MTLRFSDVESTFDYMNITRQYIEEHGKPIAFYSDKHSVFRLNRDEVKTGKQMTEFGRALFELNIDLIWANSSQAKGRVERANKTLQDRLIKEMRLAGIDSIEEANAWLPEFIADFNERFARTPHSLHDAHRPLRESSSELDDIFARQRSRVLTRQLTIQYDKVVYLIEPNDANHRLIGKPIMVYDYPDGTISIKHCVANHLIYSVFDKLATWTKPPLLIINDSVQYSPLTKKSFKSREKILRNERAVKETLAERHNNEP